MIKYVFLACIVAALIMMFLCRNYGREVFSTLERDKRSFKFIYGFAMFLLDKIIWKVIVKFQKNITEKVRILTVRDEVDKAMYLYSLRKMVICIFASFIILLLGFCICLLNEYSNEELTLLDRPAAETQTSYGLEAIVDNEEPQSIDIIVYGSQYTDKEINELFDKSYDELVSIMLGNNESKDYVNQNLNFIASLNNKVNVGWYIEDTDIVDYDGSIGENIDKNGEIISITATLTYEEHTADYEIICCVYPPAEDEKSIEEKVQSIVDEQSDDKSGKVALPSKIDGVQVAFYSSKKTETAIFLILALLFPVVIFIFKDRELDSRIKKRNIQMMCDYPEIVGKLQLLISAGMTVNNAWGKIVTEYEKKITKTDGTKNAKKIRYAYEEMSLALRRMNRGISEVECYKQFGVRCRLHPYLKLSSILEQNVKMGTKEINKILEEEVKDTFEQRKNLAKKLGEEAGTKLLGPMIMLLVMTIVLIIFPALTNVSI